MPLNWLCSPGWPWTHWLACLSLSSAGMPTFSPPWTTCEGKDDFVGRQSQAEPLHIWDQNISRERHLKLHTQWPWILDTQRPCLETVSARVTGTDCLGNWHLQRGDFFTKWAFTSRYWAFLYPKNRVHLPHKSKNVHTAQTPSSIKTGNIYLLVQYKTYHFLWL